MSDLISRETLLETFEEYGFNQEAMIPIISLMKVLEIIDNQPTAFDAEKVVEQLQTAKTNCKNSIAIYDTKDYVRLDKAIEIVKGAVKDE